MQSYLLTSDQKKVELAASERLGTVRADRSQVYLSMVHSNGSADEYKF